MSCIPTINWTQSPRRLLDSLVKAKDSSSNKSITATARRAFLILTAGLFLSACQPEPGSVANSDPVGVYTLVSVDGKNVPASVSHDGVHLQVRSGTFAFNPGQTCGTKTVFVPPSGTEVIREVSATYTRTGSKLAMKWHGAGTTSGTIEGDTFTMENEDMVFVYRK